MQFNDILLDINDKIYRVSGLLGEKMTVSLQNKKASQYDAYRPLFNVQAGDLCPGGF